MLKLQTTGSKGKTLGLFLLELFFAEAKKSGKAAKKMPLRRRKRYEKIKSFLRGTLTCGIFLVLYGLFPIVFESCLSCTVAEFYAKYCVCAMTMVSLCIVYSIQGLRWIKKNSENKADDISSDNKDAT